MQGRSKHTPHTKTHLCVSVIGFFELHVLPSLAAEVHPFPLQPLHGGFSVQVGRVHLCYEGDISPCHRKNKHTALVTL